MNFVLKSKYVIHYPFDDYKMPKELGKGDHTINDIKEFFRKRRLMSRYANKTINPAYYSNRTLADRCHPKMLTDEEFRAGKQGYVLGKFKITDL